MWLRTCIQFQLPDRILILRMIDSAMLNPMAGSSLVVETQAAGTVSEIMIFKSIINLRLYRWPHFLSYSYNTFWLWTNTGMIYRFNQSDKNWAKWDAVTCAQGPRQWSRAMPSRNRSGCRWTGRIPSRARRQWEAISCQKSVLCRIFFMINKSLFKWDKLSSK